MNNPLSNARHEGESFDSYRVRRQLMNKKIKQYLKGRFAHVAAPVVRVDLPMSADDAKMVERGLIRDLCPPLVGEGGKMFRIGVQKGSSFSYGEREAYGTLRGRAAARKKVLVERRAR